MGAGLTQQTLKQALIGRYRLVQSASIIKEI